MAWSDIHTHTVNGITIVVSKSYFERKPIYTAKFGVLKAEPGGKAYLSPFLPTENVDVSCFAELFGDAVQKIQADKERDDKLEADRVKALAAKPGTHVVRDKNAPRATGKTAKKKAKLAARAEAAKRQTQP